MGNHDFGHKDYFEKELSIPVHNGDIKRTLLGKRFYISHGDGKAANDTGYLILRSILRNSFLQSAFRVIHPDIGIRFAEWISGRSRSYTDGRDALQKSDGLRDFAEKLISHGETDFVVMGHRHKSDIVKFEKGTYINLGDWVGSYTYGVFDEEGFRIERAL
jgi:UDP-2,3-diacylglucosamine hydrolase